MPTQPAVLGTARLGNFRLGYASAALSAIRATRVRILLAGVDVRRRLQGPKHAGKEQDAQAETNFDQTIAF